MDDQQPVKEEVVLGSKNLHIIFGGIAAGIGMPPFEFYRASKILDETRVFIRDLRQNWYHSGLPGISNNITETALYIEKLLKKHSPESVTMTGNSMGGFAAILFSSMIQNSRCIAFSPQTFISPIKRLRHRDNRWIGRIIDTYAKTWNKSPCWDLANIKTNDDWSADIYVSSQHRLDFLHAKNMENVNGVKIHSYEMGGHELVKTLRDSGELARILSPDLKINQSSETSISMTASTLKKGFPK